MSATEAAGERGATDRDGGGRVSESVDGFVVWRLVVVLVRGGGLGSSATIDESMMWRSVESNSTPSPDARCGR